ncbi:aminopeptidase P N-terminal domain-containing protein [soil metagenome]
MANRRTFLASAAALAASPWQAVLSQGTGADDGSGSPAATSPFPPEVYRERRQRLMAQLKSGVAVIYGATQAAGTSGDVFRQDGDFSYLTGIQDEADAVLVLAPSEPMVKEFLLLAPRNIEAEQWEGVRLSLGETLRTRTGFETIRRTASLGALVTSLASRSGELHFMGPLASPSQPIPAALELYGKVAARVPGTAIVNSHDLIRRMRMVKEARELALIRRAIAATERGLFAAMRQARVGMREFELKNILETEFRAGGARTLAFPSIVATGKSSAVLHYTGSDRVIRGGDLILCDVGAEVGGYAADITRTFPVSGRFSPEQRGIYDTVLAAQEAAMRKLKSGLVYEEVHLAGRAVIDAAGHRDDLWHSLGHFVGLEVHDAGNYSVPLPVGSVVTIEPGIYLPEQGFGVRIEDDYLVTARGNEHLSAAVPRVAGEIEALVSAAQT